MTEMTPEQQAEHARLYGVVAKRVMQVVAEFARGVQGAFTPVEVGQMFAGAGAWLATTLIGRDGAVGMLREIADALERRDDIKGPAN